MFKKILILALFAFVCLSITQRTEAHLDEEEDGHLRGIPKHLAED